MSGARPDNPGNRRPPIPAVDPVVRFLGPGATRNGPFGLLGLPVQSTYEEEVLAAVHAAMSRIDTHPESSTPAADEVRLAVHAAAANLLDEAVHAELLRRLGAGPASGSPRIAPPRRGPAMSSGRVTLEADVLRCIAGGGGWNKKAMRHFLMIAHLKGHTTNEAMAAIRALWRGGGRTPIPARASSGVTVPALDSGASPPPGRPAQSAREPAPRDHSPEDPGQGVPPAVAALLTVVVFALLFLVAWLVWDGFRPPAEPGRIAALPTESIGTPQRPDRTETDIETHDESENPEPGRRLDSGPAIIHEFGVALDGLALDAEGSIETFEQAASAMADHWGELSPVDRLAAHDQIVGFVYRVGSQRSLAERAMRALEAGADGLLAGEIEDPGDVWRGAWSMGMLVRLRREQNLPGTIIRRIDSVLLRAPGGLSPNASTFRAGAVAALRSMSRGLAEPPVSRGGRAAWAVWPDAARASAAGDDALSDSLILGALESVLRHRSANAVLDEIATNLVAELTWRQGGAARVWLLRSFDDRTLGPDDLHVLTLALATRSRAEGVDHSMVLPRGSSEFARRRLRDVFRDLWGIESRGDQSQTVAAFTAAAREELLREPNEDGRDEAEKFAAVARLARLNTAGALAWRGETAPASDLLASLDDPISAVLESEQVPDASNLFETKTGTWAEAYLGAGSHIPRRIELLDKLMARRDRLGPMEAGVVVAEALRGSPQRVRDAAAGVVEASLAQPVIVNAVLESLPMMPRTDRNARIIELASGVSLPRVDAADWPLEARRAVVERLLELIAGHGVYARLDALAVLLDEAYDIHLRGPGNPESPGVPPPAGLSARGLADEWSDLAARRPPSGLRGYAVDEIERRRAARLAMAEGLVQDFHVEQLALAELMAQVVAAEQPGYVPRVDRLLGDHQIARDRARNVLDQIEHTERLMLALRMLRFGEERG